MIRHLFSTRVVVILTSILAYIIAVEGKDAIFGNFMNFQTVLIAILVLTALSISATAFWSFDIESKRDFVTDIFADIVVLMLAVALLAHLLTRSSFFQDVEAEALVLAVTAFGLALLDFLVSLNAGAGKLLEMDREHISKGGN